MDCDVESAQVRFLSPVGVVASAISVCLTPNPTIPAWSRFSPPHAAPDTPGWRLAYREVMRFAPLPPVLHRFSNAPCELAPPAESNATRPSALDR